MKATECFTDTSTSPRFSQPAGAPVTTRTALAPGAMWTQVQADRTVARAGIRSRRIGVFPRIGTGHCERRGDRDRALPAAGRALCSG